MHVLCTQGKDGSRGVAQIWIVGHVEYAMLVMLKHEYWTVRIYINDDDRTRLKTGLKRNGIPFISDSFAQTHNSSLIPPLLHLKLF